MANPRYLTKSRFKLGLECPTKLFYTGKPNIYPDKKVEDPFLLALAKGGFQIGELAKCYFPQGVEVESKRGDYEGALSLTQRLMGNDPATIFEAAIRFENYFIRVDILERSGDQIHLIEVKSKSFSKSDPGFIGKRGGILAEWKSYLYDIAFQKFVAQSAFPSFNISASLMLTDKDAICPTDGLNQKFRVFTTENGQKYVHIASALEPEEIAQRLLTVVPVDDVCEMILSGVGEALPLAEVASRFAASYNGDQRLSTPISSTCGTCEFRCTSEEEAAGLKSGYKECWTAQLNWSAEDFTSPTILDIWDNRSKDKMLNSGKIKLSDLTIDDFNGKAASQSGLSRSERQWMQVEKALDSRSSHYIDIAGLTAEIDRWRFPLHFIDFETATPAIPFNKGRRPYEEVAFQFSHHIVYMDGSVAHAGEYLDKRIAVFPNYDFVRALAAELTKDEGTIFRYAAHENTYLLKIHDQIVSDGSSVPDGQDLCTFIQSITTKKDEWKGERTMVDMLDLVKRFFYHPYMGGSNSIKKVLPAMLRASDHLQAKYSVPDYGKTIRSFNFADGVAWVNFVNGELTDPYASLPKVFGIDFIDRLSDEDDLKDGGAAMMAYARLQFEDMSDAEREAICAALKRYCELDTLAMVMIYEGWREMVK